MRKSTWMAVVIFSVLAGASVWSLTRKPERGISRLDLSSLDLTRLDKIDIAGPTPITLNRATDGTWQVPSGRPADSSAIDALLSAVTHIHSTDVLTQDANRFTEMEVDADKGRDVSLFSHGQKVAQVVVGKAVGSATAMRMGDTVYRVKDVFNYVFARSAMEWTERHMFTDTAADVARLNVHLKDQPPYTLMNREKGWELLEDKSRTTSMRFDPSTAQTLLNALLTLQAQELLDKDPGVEVTQLDANADSWTWFFKDTAQATTHAPSRMLFLGASHADKQVYARIDGRDGVFTVPENIATSLRRALTDLRDMTMMQVNPEQVVSLRIDDGKTSLAFERADAKAPWKLVKGRAPAGFELDPSKITRRVNMAANVRANAVAPTQALTRAGFKGSQIVLGNAEKRLATLKFGAATDNGVYAQGNVDEELYVVGTYLRDQLLGGLDTFKKTAPEADPLAQLDPKALESLPPEIRANLQAQIAKKKREQAMLQQMQPRPGTP